VSHGKPDPEVFLKAAERLELEPQRCLVFEDAYVGIEAGHAAGMKVIAVTTTHMAEELRAADLVVRRLDELSLEQTEELLLQGKLAAGGFPPSQ
jgi:beta-phosphoglucomutase